MQEDLVSIITPLYNGERFVGQTIESVIAQTYSNWEMIIINDGSRDNSEAVALQYAQSDHRISVFSQPNSGSAAARNNGIRRAKGRYLALLDADDLWDPCFLESQLQLLKETGGKLVCAAHRRIDDNGNECLKPFYPPREAGYRDLLKTCSISCLTALYDSKEFGKFYLREDLGSLRDDYVLWLDMVKKIGVVYGNQKVIASYRILSSQLTANKRKMIKPQFRVYRQEEHLGVFRSLYYLGCWAVKGVLKYKK